MPSSEEHVSWGEGLYHDPLPVGGIAAALMLGTYGLLKLPVSIPLLVAGGCGAALVYGFDRGLVRSPEDAVNHPGRQRWVRAHWRWLVGEALLLGSVGVGALAFLRTETVLGAAGLSVFAALHLLPVERWGRPLKGVGVIKPMVVAGAWAIGGTLLPVIEAEGSIGTAGLALAGYRLCFILPNVLLADWADRRGDVAAGLSSWTRAGTGRGVRWTATGLLVLAIAGAAFTAGRAWSALLLLVDAGGPLLMLGAVWTLDPSHPGHRFLMDGIVAWPIVTALVAWTLGWTP